MDLPHEHIRSDPSPGEASAGFPHANGVRELEQKAAEARARSERTIQRAERIVAIAVAAVFLIGAVAFAVVMYN